MFNKSIFVSLLLSSSFAFAQNPASLPVEKKKEIVNYYEVENGHLIINKFDKNKIPESVSNWINWVKKDNPLLDCPMKEQNSVNCIFIASAILEDNADNVNLQLKGSAYTNESWVKLPFTKDIWPKKVFQNNKEAIIAEKNNIPYVKVEKGDFQISIQYSKNDFKKLQSFELSNDLLSFTNKSNLKIVYENGFIYLNKEETNLETNKENTNALNEIKVFRKLTDSIPLLLETKIIVTYSGIEKEMELGEVLPKDFILLGASSDLKITYRDNKYYTIIKPGEHFFKFNAYNKTNPQNIITEKLIPQIEQEVWSINVNPNIRQLNITQAKQVDANQVFVPIEWKESPAYLVTNQIGLLTEKRGVNLNNTINVVENRTSWYGYNDNKMMNNSIINISNNTQQYFSVNPEVKLYSIKINDNPQMLVKKDQQQGIISYDNNFNATVQTEINDIYNIPAKFFNADINNQSWALNLAPRYRVIGGLGVENINGSWLDSWNLYNLFALCIITISFYKLFGKTISFLAFISILSFQDNSFLTWIIWIGILLVASLLKVLPEDKHSHLTTNIRKLGIVMFILLTVFSLPYITNEIRLIINPSLEMKYGINNYSTISLFNVIALICNIGIIYFIYKAIESKKYVKNILKLIGVLALLGISNIFSTGSMFSTKSEKPLLAHAPAAPTPMMKSAPEMDSSVSYSPALKNNISQKNVLEELEREKVKQEDKIKKEDKIQVGIALPTWQGQIYHIELKKSYTDKISLIIVSPLLVNIMGIIQIIILLISMCMVSLYLFYAYDKNNWIDKVPNNIKNNWLIKKLLKELMHKKSLTVQGE